MAGRGAAWPSSIQRERNVLIGAGKKEKEALRRQREARQAAGIKPRGMRPSRIHSRKRPAHEPAVLSDDELREYCREVDATLIGSCKNHELYDWWLDFGPECKELSKTCVSRNS